MSRPTTPEAGQSAFPSTKWGSAAAIVSGYDGLDVFISEDAESLFSGSIGRGIVQWLYDKGW